MKTITLKSQLKALLAIFLVALTLGCKKEEENKPEQKPVEINADINAATVWKNIVDNPSKPDYIIKKAQLQVNETLTIEAGVVVAFEADGMMRLPINTKGFILGKGTATNPIRFTGVVQTLGSWRGILILSPDDRNEFDHCIFENGGSAAMQTFVPLSNLAIFTQSNVSGKLRLTNCTFRNSAGYGFYVGGNAIINTFSSNTFSNNASASILTTPSQVQKLDKLSVYNIDNGAKRVEISADDFTELTEHTWKNLGTGVFYRINGDINILSGLNIEEGANFEMATNVMLRVKFPSGYLIAKGTAQKIINFQGVVNSKGTWKGILFNSSDTRNELSYCTVSNGGGQSMFTGLSAANIGLITQSGNTGRVTVTNCNIQNSAGCGMAKDASSVLTESGNTHTGNTGNNICN